MDSEESLDIPQADNLALVRAITQSVATHVTNVNALAARHQVTTRHARYCINASRILGWLELVEDQLSLDHVARNPTSRFELQNSGRIRVTERGQNLLATEPLSVEERTLIFQSILSSTSLARIVQSLSENPGTGEIAERLKTYTSLSAATVERRARTIETWLRYALDRGRQDSATISQAGITGQKKSLIQLDIAEQAYLTRYLENGRLVLICDWSFASHAKNRSGAPIPGDREIPVHLRGEFKHADDPDLRLHEFLQLALQEAQSDLRDRLSDLLVPQTIPQEYRFWLSGPWQRIYYLGVDTIPDAVNKNMSTARRVAFARIDQPEPTMARHGSLQLVRLNGDVASHEWISFHDRAGPLWTAVSVDLIASPFIAVANAEPSQDLLEILLMRGRKPRQSSLKGERELRPKSFLICPALSEARRELLLHHNVHWLHADSETFAKYLEETSLPALTRGVAYLKQQAESIESAARNAVNVLEATRVTSQRSSGFLMGYEPDWSDITSGRAIVRSFDDGVLNAVSAKKQMCHLVVGTAGSGKSTSLMRLGYALTKQGFRVHFIGTDVEVSPQQLREVAEQSDYLLVDDIGRYGREWPAVVREVIHSTEVTVVATTRSGKRLDTDRIRLDLDESYVEHVIPWLSDRDIERLLAVLAREHRLGRLRALPDEERRQRIQQNAGRQLLVAMIEATSGRRFDEKVEEEWSDLDERGRYFYALTAMATAMKYSLQRRELLLAAAGTRTESDIRVVDYLIRTHLIVEGRAGQVRTRHRVIAERLLDRVVQNRHLIAHCVEGLAYAVAIDLRPSDGNYRVRRFLRLLLGHENLVRMVGVAEARRVYTRVEDCLHWDAHFWLQRGALELEHSQMSHAEQFLEQAYALDPGDRVVRTTYANMLLKKAADQALALDAEEWFETARAMLHELIKTDVRHDEVPYHVLGAGVLRWATSSSQGRLRKSQLIRETLQLIKQSSRHVRFAEMIRDLEADMVRRLLELES